MESIIRISIKRPLLIIVIFTILAVGGIVSFNLLNLNLIPKFELSTITVQTVYPGASATEVENSVTVKIEDALSTLENLSDITSTSLEGISIVTVKLKDGANSDQSVPEAQRKINAIKSDLPSEILDPSIDKLALDEKAILSTAVSSNLAPTEFYNLLDDRIQPRLAKIEGVGSVSISGGLKREIKVNIDIKKLEAFNLSILQVFQAIQTSNMEIPVGNVEDDQSTYSVRLAAKFTSLDELRNTIIKTTADGGKITVADVADVEDGIADQKLINRIDGKEAIGVAVSKQADANAVEVADLVKEEILKIEEEYSADNLKFEIASDDSIYTKASANSVAEDLLLAILIVAIVCYIFLHDLRSAAIIMVSIPLSMIPVFVAMYALGFTLNMMSLLSLSLVVGILVDDSIVVVENMFHHLEMGKSKRKAAFEGSKQIMYTAMAITLVIVVVFVPMAITGGTIGNMLKEFAVPIIITVLCSLLVSYTVTPLLMSRFGKKTDNNPNTVAGRFSLFVEKTFNSLKNWYGNVLAVGLRHKMVILLGATVLFIGSISLFSAGFIGFAFMPEIDKGEFTVSLEMSPQVTVAENNQITMQVEDIISNNPDVVSLYTNVGMSTTSSKNNSSTITVKMLEKEKRKTSVDECANSIKSEIMEKIPGVKAQTIVASLSGTTSEPIQYIVQGTDMDLVKETASMIFDVVKSTPGTADVKYSIDDPRQEVQIELDREKMADMGLSASDVGSTLRVTLNGNDDVKFTENNIDYDIRIGIDNFDRNSSDDVANIKVMNNEGELIELSQIANISYGQGASALERTDRISSITVKSNVVGRASGTVGSEITEAISDKIPEGVTIKLGEQMQMQSSAFSSLGYAFLAAVVLIYLIMVVLYDSVLDPIVVLFSIPLSFIGAFLALALTMTNLTIFSIIGLIVLIGLVAKNAILLVDFTNHMIKDKKMNTFDALIEAGKERLRPILMTTFAMIFGMLPIALATGNAAELKNGMAWVIIGGLTSSMILTLIVVPIVFLIFDKIRSKFNRKKRRKLVKKVEDRVLVADGKLTDHVVTVNQ